YPFALDFTPTTTFSVESFTVTCEVESCEITMPRNDQAELYTVHFTNSPTAANLQGPADVVFATILGEGYGEFYETASFTNPSGTGEITYLLESTNLRASDNYFFTITVTENSQESEITHFEQVTIG
ncbi:MAG: hypothetical protein KJ771_01855, partial [Nanoarchaeota archaeon]|nr:hypothetical protein [Nanoarchaeota archaeon]